MQKNETDTIDYRSKTEKLKLSSALSSKYILKGKICRGPKSMLYYLYKFSPRLGFAVGQEPRTSKLRPKKQRDRIYKYDKTFARR